MIRHCAKCGKMIDTDDYGSYTSMGEMTYGIGLNPFICKPCRNKWGKCTKRLRGKNWVWHKHEEWRKHFEEWLGYKWKNVDFMAIEKVVFT